MTSAADNQGFQGRLPPQNLDAELSVLGSLFLSRHAVDEVMPLIKAEHFYADRNQRIFAAIVDLHSRNSGVDAVIVAEELQARGELESVGGVEYLTTICETVPTAANARYYAQIVRDRWLERSVIYTCTELITSGFDREFAAEELLAAAETKILAISDQQVSETTDLTQILVAAMGRIQERRNNRGILSGLATGFTDLDQTTGGLQGGQLIVLAARPAMGKTAFVCSLAMHVTEQEKSVLVFSLEMSKLELVDRLLCQQARINGHALRVGETTADQYSLLMDASETLSQRPLMIDDRAGITVSQMAAICRRQKRRGGLDLVIIDYLQLVQPEDKKTHREQQVAQMTRSLKILSKELDVPVIVLAQLNRQVEHRDNKRPHLSDLRESGAIEQDADMVWFLHRPSVYDPEDRPGEAELLISKQRNGPTGIVTLAWLQSFMRFDNFAHNHTQQPLFA